tara:strand:+ start:1133 stop:2065 length:933 start_codon:yes stop_codon:yes gene_type:complete
LVDITFKYVGNGDSIIIEYLVNDSKKIGVIDVCTNAGNNAVLSHIKKEQYSKIEFLIISHFHHDHCSGLKALLKYCEDNKIEIGFFGFPILLDKRIIRSLKIGKQKKHDVGSAFKYAYDLYKADLIHEMKDVGLGHEGINLNNKYTLKFISPAIDELNRYTAKVFDKGLKLKDSPNHNIVAISTVIESDSEYVLLTSDIEFNSLKRIGRRILKNYSKKLILAQVPHHGSRDNHYKEFWNLRNRDIDTPIVISCGPNGYDHPAPEVIIDLEKLDYKVEATSNPVGSSLRDIDVFAMKDNSNIDTRDLKYQI